MVGKSVALYFEASGLLLLAILTFAGCGSDSSSTSPPATLSGTVSEGPLAGATVSVFSVNPVNGVNQSLLAQTQTDSAGNFSIHLGAAPQGPARITASGGTFVSEQDGATIGGPAELSLLLKNINSGFSGSLDRVAHRVCELTHGRETEKRREFRCKRAPRRHQHDRE